MGHVSSSRLPCIVLLTLTPSGPGECGRRSKTRVAKRIDVLIVKLGSGKFQERRAAQKALEAIGAAGARTTQTSAYHRPGNQQTRSGVDSQNRGKGVSPKRMLAAKHVHLNVKEMPALDAVNELARLAGTGDSRRRRPQQGGRQKNHPRHRRTSSFWQACDRLSRSSGLGGSGARRPCRPPMPTACSLECSLPTRIRALRLCAGHTAKPACQLRRLGARTRLSDQ